MMHNLFLGTGKHMLQFWLDSDAIPKSYLPRVQTFVDEMAVPSDIGRIPHKIVSGFSGFTADQLKTGLSCILSLPLYKCLPYEHFILACRILCQKHLSHEEVPLFDAFLLRFCQQLEQLCGANFITPNMHMHAHLRAVVEDYGPIFGFWLFSFEHYNEILGNQSNNNRDIDIQLLSRFVRDNQAYSYKFPKQFQDDFRDVCTVDECMVGSLLDTCSMITEFSSSDVVLPPVATRSVLNSDDAAYVQQLYLNLNPVRSECVTINSIYTDTLP